MRDKLGRIDTKTETIEGVATTYRYGYDLSGRLTDVYLNGSPDPVSHYDYDDNGNRIGRSDYSGAAPKIDNGAYDAQDRMTSYGNAEDGYATYEYTANGELISNGMGKWGRTSDVHFYREDRDTFASHPRCPSNIAGHGIWKWPETRRRSHEFWRIEA